MSSTTNPRGERPGQVGFHGDRYLLRLVEFLAERVEVFVETGTNLGTTLGYVARSWPDLEALSCEPDPAACATAREHLPARAGIELHQETSQEFLRRLAQRPERFERPALFWLDAHGYGFEWPLADELAFISANWSSGFVLIDDFEVPGRPEFGFDQYQDQICSFEHVSHALAPGWRHRLYYPAYTEHTSSFHPLRGWGLLQFGPGPLPRLDFEQELQGVLALARSRPPAPAPAVPASTAPATSTITSSTSRPGPHEVAPPGAFGAMARRDRFDDLLRLVGLDEPVVVDGGAHRGHTYNELRRRSPRALIHSVEPIPEHAAEIATNAAGDGRLAVHAVALGAQDGEIDFNVTASSDASSRFEPSALTRSLHGDNAEVRRRLRVPVRRLDGLIEQRIDAVKLDLQGAELEALVGLGERLEREVRALLVEVEFAPLYDGQPLFGEVDRYLRERGFELFNLYELWTSRTGRLTSGDAIYVHPRFVDLT